ncbi:DoxX-like family protein [Candidatus Peregrinibacteria bacterium CG10_big_fil_rev_8_21_14_0_10_42_8]|nr:MAG: DoxX-like family protein [Candidatus Peregrinibacteria bacterium CG10_big_fil_rev_8_21_14_0_10_42_8]
MKKKLFYWIPTTLLLIGMVGSAISYFMDIPTAAENFALLGYPGYVLYFNGAAKILGGLAIVLPVSRILKEWAYAGYLFILLLATQALYIMMPEYMAPMAGFYLLWVLSYWQFRVQS